MSIMFVKLIMIRHVDTLRQKSRMVCRKTSEIDEITLYRYNRRLKHYRHGRRFLSQIESHMLVILALRHCNIYQKKITLYLYKFVNFRLLLTFVFH